MSQLEHADGIEPAADLFKEAFKRYKKKDADLNEVIDITRPQQYEKEVKSITYTSHPGPPPKFELIVLCKCSVSFIFTAHLLVKVAEMHLSWVFLLLASGKYTPSPPPQVKVWLTDHTCSNHYSQLSPSPIHCVRIDGDSKSFP